jgi:activator of HSP90 ATPase
MQAVSINRRAALAGIAGLSCLTAAARVLAAAGTAQGSLGLSHDAALIRQRVDLRVPAERIYGVLTDAAAFDAMTTQETDMKVLDKPSVLTPDVGAAFSLFGGYISGRNVELVPGRRIVQAWRTTGWQTGFYSIVQMEFSPKDHGTQLIFEHRGFPDSQGEHLATGWYLHYWEPLKAHLK